MQSSFNKERQWVVSNPIATEGALHNMYSSDSDRDGGSDDTDEDEGFGVDHSPVHHQVSVRSVQQSAVIFLEIMGVGDVSRCG